MSQRNWLSYVILGIIIGLGTTLVLFAAFNLLGREGQIRAGHQDRGQLQQRYDNNGSFPSGNVATENVSGPEARTNPDHPQFYEHQDLRAQESMAESTEAIVFWTQVSIGLGIIGTGAIIWTLIETRRSVQIANKAITVENRPWVNILPGCLGDMNITKRGAQMSISVRAFNVGGNPAHRVHVEAKAIAFDSADQIGEIKRWLADRSATYKEQMWDRSLFVGMEASINTVAVFPGELARRQIEATGTNLFACQFAIAVFYMSDFDEAVHHTASLCIVGIPRGHGGLASIPFEYGRVTADQLTISNFNGLIIAR